MEKRYFAFRKAIGSREQAVFTGRQPRQAALKAASRGFTDIFLRERGTRKIHQFKGTRKKVAAPYNRPDWMAATVWKPNVRKVSLIKPKVVKKAKKVKKKAVRKVKKAVRKVKKKAAKKVKRKDAKKKPARAKAKRRRR